ncbi:MULTISPECIES: SDR family NAD(P)-dependent oxidoreductase [unclassified Micromonospora]|uniref:SDR family oxidoreductase n=1 Tax=unclassified Micromonospora TaxID=2617518 RepID=UPI0033E5F2A5
MTSLVVGGRGAIGAAVVDALRRDGETVHVLDRADGVDAADPRQVSRFLDALPEAPTRVAHLAGSVGHGGLLDVSPEQWRQVLDDSLTSAYVVVRAVLPAMLAAGGGAIVLMSSVNGRHGGNAMSGPAYAAAKAGVLALTRNVAKEFGGRGVRANAVAPGPVRSVMTERLSARELSDLVGQVPLRRPAEPAEVAETIAFLLGERASYVNGATVDVNGGMWTG